MVPSDKSAWVTIGWIFAFVFPLAGFVIGFCLPRKDSQHGLWIMAVSVVVGVIFLATYPR
jgi:biotin transporter BioY